MNDSGIGVAQDLAISQSVKKKKTNKKKKSSQSKAVTFKEPEPDPEQVQRKQQLEKRIRKQVAFEEAAFRLVERLLDNPVSQELLKSAGRQISVAHYQDITDERAIARQCGYPLCQNSINSVSKQKYHISLKTNRVYDISDRKNFCSNGCYKASNYFKSQIPESPVWAREEEDNPQIQLIDHATTSGSLGEAVIHKMESETSVIVNQLEAMKEVTRRKADSESDEERKLNEGSNDEEDENEIEITTEQDLSQKLSDMLLLDENTDGRDTAVCTKENYPSSSDMPTTLGATGGTHTTVNTIKENQAKKKDTEDSNVIDNYQETELKISDTDMMVVSPQERCWTVEPQTSSQTQVLMDLLKKRERLRDSLKQTQESGLEASVGQKMSHTSGVESDKLPFKSDEVHCDQTAEQNESHKISDLCLSAGGEAKSGITEEVVDDIKPSISKTYEVISPNSDPVREFGTSSESKQGTRISSCNNSKPKQPKIDRSQVIDNIRRLQQSDSDSNASKQRDKQVKKNENPCHLAELLQKILIEWRSDLTVSYLTDASDSEELAREEFRRKYEKLGQKLDEEEIRGRMENDKTDDQREKKKLPDMKELQKQTTLFDMQVREFYKGSTKLPMDLPEDIEVTENETPPEDSVSPVLPPIDNHSQMVLRRKIVLDKINKELPHLLTSLGLMIGDVSSELRQLLITFKLTPTNILLKPAEWNLMTYILLRVLSVRVPTVRNAFKEERAAPMLHMYSQLGLTEAHVNNIITIMTSQHS